MYLSFVFEVILFGGNMILLARQKFYQITSCREDVMPHHCIATGDGNTGDFNLIKIFLTKNIGIRYKILRLYPSFLRPARMIVFLVYRVSSHKHKYIVLVEHGLCHQGTREMHKNANIISMCVPFALHQTS